MAVTQGAIVAGTGAGGTSGAELVWFASPGSTAPTNALSVLSTTAANEVQTVTITGTPTGGTVTLSLDGYTSSAIAYNAVAATVQTALEALTSIGTGNVTVTGGPGPGTAWVVTFTGTEARQGQSLLIATSSLTGGTTPAIGVVRTTPGVSGWLSAGWITEDGASENVNVNSNTLGAYGSGAPVRTVETSKEITVKTVMMETNLVTAAVYNKYPLGTLATTSGGLFTTTRGPVRTEYYSMVSLLVDGARRVLSYYPIVENTSVDGREIKKGAGIFYGVTLTAYPDSSNNSAYTYHYIPALG